MQVWKALTLAAPIALISAAPSWAQMTGMQDQPPPNTECSEVSLLCADTVTPTFAADGQLWLAARAGNRVFVTRSQDLGRSFTPPVVVSPEGSTLDWGPDARPKIVTRDSRVAYLAYAIFRDKHFNGEVFHTRSLDGGVSFETPRPITAVQESQRFEGLALDSDGSVFAAWLDKRDRVQARERGMPYIGAGLAFAWSHDDGASFEETRVAFDSTCECCRLAVGFAAPGRPVVLFRNAFDGKVRDHGVTTFVNTTTPGPVRRVSIDDWETDVCPHHGPTLAIGPDGSYHAAWFTQGRARKGLYYAYSRDQGLTFSAPMQIGDASRSPTRPYLLTLNGATYLAWKEFDGENTAVKLRVSHDGGAVWSADRVIATTEDDSDHPMLLSNGRAAFLSWRTKIEGYRLIDLGDRT